MQNTHLSEYEIDGINLFISKVVDIPSVEGVYLLPYLSKIKECKFAVIAVFNNGLATCSEEALTMEDSKSLLNDIFKCGRLSFSSQNIAESPTPLTHNRYFLAEQALASGKILFDKFGNIAAKKKQIEERVGSFSNVVAVDNIQSVIVSSRAAILKYTKEST